MLSSLALFFVELLLRFCTSNLQQFLFADKNAGAGNSKTKSRLARRGFGDECQHSDVSFH